MTSLDLERRWQNYRKANFDRPTARENELMEMFHLLDPKSGERIWEVGTGNGYLTFPVAEAVTPSGEVVTTDVEKGNYEAVIEKNRTRQLPITSLLLGVGASPMLTDAHGSYFDAVTSVATLHHFDNRKQATGHEGRVAALRECYDRLKPGGRLVLGDPLHGTTTQQYFDAIDSPEYCAPEGHPYDFFTADELVGLLTSIGFRDVHIEVKTVPWKFASRNEAAAFVHTIHNARVSPEESLRLAERILGFSRVADHYELGWELFFLTAKK